MVYNKAMKATGVQYTKQMGCFVKCHWDHQVKDLDKAWMNNEELAYDTNLPTQTVLVNEVERIRRELGLTKWR